MNSKERHPQGQSSVQIVLMPLNNCHVVLDPDVTFVKEVYVLSTVASAIYLEDVQNAIRRWSRLEESYFRQYLYFFSHNNVLHH